VTEQRARNPEVIAFLRQEPLPLAIAGSWRTTGQTFGVEDPANGAILCQVCAADSNDVNDAVKAARAAFLDGRWQDLRPDERALGMLRWAQLIERDVEMLAELESLQTGKPIREARGDVLRALDGLRFYAAAARNIRGETINVSRAHHSYVEREPLGVIACIVPWNVPIVLTMSKAAPALAAGNSVVVKPSQTTPLTAIRLAQLWDEAGLPGAVFSVINGSGRTVGEALAVHPEVAMVTFTGSTDVGLRLGELAARRNTRIMLELGGKSPNIVLDDADIERAVVGAAQAIFYGQGQICAAGSRLLIQDSVYDEVLEGVVAQAKALCIGDPLDPATEFGSLTSVGHRDEVLGWVRRAEVDGARVVAGGGIPSVANLPNGAFMEPTILVDVPPTAPIACEEVFGPVLVVQRVRDDEDAIAVANDSTFGLSAGIWTRDSARARRMARRLETGVVWINDYGKFHPAMPFGGVKLSGSSHREWSHLAMDAFLEHKSIWEWVQ